MRILSVLFASLVAINIFAINVMRRFVGPFFRLIWRDAVGSKKMQDEVAAALCGLAEKYPCIRNTTFIIYENKNVRFTKTSEVIEMIEATRKILQGLENIANQNGMDHMVTDAMDRVESVETDLGCGIS